MNEPEIMSLLGSLHEKLDLLAAFGERLPQRYLTVANAAAYCDLSEESIRRLIASRKLTAHRPVRGRVLVDRHELEAVIRNSIANPRGGRGQTKPL